MAIVAAEELDAGLDDGRRRARRRAPRAAVEPAHRRIELGALALHADAHRRRRDAGAAGHRGRAALRRRRVDAHDARLHGRRARRSHRDLRVAVGRGGAGHGAGRAGDAEGSEPVHADRQADDPPRRTRHRHRQGEVRARPRRSPAAPTVVARAPTIGGSVLHGRRLRRARHARRARHRAHPERGRGRGRRPSIRPRRRATRCGSRGIRARTPRLSDAQIRAKLEAAAPPFVAPPLGSLVGRHASSTSRSRRTRRSKCSRASPTFARDSAEIWYGAKSPIVASQAGRGGGRPPGRQGDAARRSRGRLVRSPALLRARDRSRAGVEGARPSGQVDVDAQRRHAPRTDATGQPSQGARHVTCSATCSPTSTGTRRCPSTSRTASARRSAPPGSTSCSPGATQTRVRAHPERAVRLRRRDADADRRAARVPDRLVALDLLGPDRDRQRDHGRRDRAGAPHAIRSRSGARSSSSARTRAVLDKVDERRAVGPLDAGRHRAGRRDPRGVQVGGRVPRRDRLPGSQPRPG